MDGNPKKSYRQSSSAPEVVPQDNVYMELDTQKTSFNNGRAEYHIAQNSPPAHFQSLHTANARTGKRICGLSVIAFCVVFAFLTFVVGAVVGGSIGGAIVSKSNKSSAIATTTVSAVTAMSSNIASPTSSSASSTATTNAAGCNTSNGTTYSSTAYPGTKFVVLCNIDIQATTDIGTGQVTYTLGACLDLCARHNNVTTDLRCIGATWVLSSSIDSGADQSCFLKATEGTQVGPNGQSLVSGLLL